ncbi:hypothetical protein [Synechococcus elongatus]|uniref:Uncharacterized protein n=1 Tax=Synechococcus elongatus (strain ATCC 33912 / PCC 7942 / FACHB-805) TaxID=1140 RepID=Q31QM0_SYNE7|nr:hypothetical protein [Synechococcus elongatus]ABB56649.1 conserved hypothetical protein [Synechococcus elongatus PCC 7942 = FACHB-805]AJD58806.1 hypothetical protein M744_13755 [Synechococcus elongatus UTEX 2973]MBD2588993.1 hypothetical protein [Synechococcus elongatus FACHB-242]MBD2690059.1 hypothetical protein [Synechococcus elongatus FACHB-1061]MBD2708502.1 hypothetical protein [Synechococcus elongatus PCC 7942 = FACHB-805]
MLILDLQAITDLQSQLADWPAAVRALQEIADCDGAIEDAAINLALQAGLEPNTSDRWLEGLAKRYRAQLCTRIATQQPLSDHDLRPLLAALEESGCPELLRLPVALWVRSLGIERFCDPLAEKLQ